MWFAQRPRPSFPNFYILIDPTVHTQMAPEPDVTPAAPEDEQPAIGLIGMGAMGGLYARILSEAGWKKCVCRAAAFLRTSVAPLCVSADAVILAGYTSATCPPSTRR